MLIGLSTTGLPPAIQSLFHIPITSLVTFSMKFEGDYNFLGAFTLEALGLVLDPLKRELKPMWLLLASFTR